MRETETIWMNGEFIDWADAKVHVGVHGLHYGSGVFEGIRCYETPDGPAVFSLREHIERLHNSARLRYMEIPCARRRTSWSAATGCPSAISARSRSTATASWVCTRRATRSKS